MKEKLLRSTHKFLATLVLFLLVYGVAIAQKNVSGKVTVGTTNQPLPGATVSVKGTNVATSTSTDGVFSIAVPGGKDILVVSFIGFDM